MTKHICIIGDTIEYRNQVVAVITVPVGTLRERFEDELFDDGEDTISQLESELSHQDGDLADLEQENMELEEEIRKLNEQLSNLQEEIYELTHKD